MSKSGRVPNRPGVRWRLTGNGAKTYEARWHDSLGKLQSKSGFNTAKAASEFREDMMSEMRKGWSGDLAAQRRTWKEVSEQWLSVKTSSGTKSRTIDGYRRILHQHYSTWDNRKMGSLTPADVTTLISRARKANGQELGDLTKHNIFNVASAVFDFALRHRIIASNPARVVREDLPKRAPAMEDAKERVRFLTPPEVNRLAEAVRSAGLAADRRKGIRPDELKAEGDALMIQFLAWTGLRRGEAGGLRLVHLDPLRNVVRVQETVVRQKDVGWIVGTPKTKRSRRSVPVPPTLMKSIIEWCQRKGTGPEDYIWGRGDQPRDMASFHRRRFTPATKAAGLNPMRIHDLRHTYASLMAHLGHRPLEVSTWMGHSNISFTLQTYTHLFEDHEQDVARSEKLDAAYLSSGTAGVP
ncbi:tyrosine-type recombinase/integrase [Aeromicrobium sp. HA]|uniref:tyrosine-type recombinase/integrase n=1 Tax=Aeromicrobium sp. HA TaxID=3009077 RepID=UPI0022AF98AC|nr:site-specific integrase [Aeromicrobium sp. HA]